MSGQFSNSEIPQSALAHNYDDQEDVVFESFDDSSSDKLQTTTQPRHTSQTPKRKTNQAAERLNHRQMKRERPTLDDDATDDVTDDVTEEEDDLTITELFQRWLISSAAVSCILSFLFHASLLIVLSVIILNQAMKAQQIVTVVNTEENDEIGDLIEEMDTKLSGGSELQEIKLPNVQFVPTDNLLQQPLSQLDMQLPSLEGDGDQDTDGSGNSGFKFAMPNIDNIVRKGSFTAWTVPEDPRPNQDYLIIIQIELPKRIRRYPRGDLSGKVVGTDFYYQPIPGRGPRTLPIRKNKVQLQVKVPGAAQLVRDTILIESKILKESQKLEIVF